MKNKILCIISAAAPFFTIWGISYIFNKYMFEKSRQYFPMEITFLVFLAIGALMIIYPIFVASKVYPNANKKTAICLLIGGIVPTIFIILYLFTTFPAGVSPSFHVIGDLPWSFMAGAYLLFDVFIAVKIFKREKQV